MNCADADTAGGEEINSAGNGAPGRDRTRDLRFTKPLLYQLSYKGNALRLAYFAAQ